MVTQSKRYGLDEDSFGVHARILKMVRPGSKVLEIGTADGYVGEMLQALGCTVTGVEVNKQMAPKYAIVGNVEDRQTLGKIKGRFEYILLADVLEHLVKPAQVVKRLTKFLAKDGRVVISVPNVAFVTYRLLHLMGKWDYEDWGIMDRDHVRWFTKITICRLVEECGLKVESCTGVGNFTQLPVYMQTLYPWVGKWTRWRMFEQWVTARWPEGLAVQLLVICKK